MEKVKVLISDNNTQLLNLNADLLLSAFNDDIRATPNKDEAIELLKTFKPDILVTDINFNSDDDPKQSDLMAIAGVTIARAARINCPFIKIIASSGYRNDDLVFQKILEKDWYDEFHTKGTVGLLDLYKKLRYEVLVFKTGLIPKLSKFFAPTNFGWEINKSIYRLLHTNYTREENLLYLDDIVEYYNSFKDMLDKKNMLLLDNFFETYKERDVTDHEREYVKESFYFSPHELPYSNNFPRRTLYCEKNIILGIWNKIISESRDNSVIDKVTFSCDKSDFIMKFTIIQPNEFDFKKFISSNKTYYLYKTINNYGNMIIKSNDKELDILTGVIKENENKIDGTIIDLSLKIIPTSK
ncbi:MAG: hypothetical protein JXR69_06825 [Candidatus Delongbacteria bacterium]|nr:hypothetical protein [Candidatus Delongbacteria bacterium]